MLDYNEHADVLKALGQVQSSEEDMREAVRDCQYFLEKDDGQWESDIVAKLKNRPRYTDDRCNPIVDSIAGEMEDNEFAIRISPASGEASKDTAETLEGLLRNIQNISGASVIYSAVNRNLVGAGFSCVEATQDYMDCDTFDQDLFIRMIDDAQNRVWFDDNSKRPDRSDANWCVVLDEVTKSEYEDKFPDGKMLSLGSERTEEVYDHKPDTIAIGRLIYKKPVDIKLVQMSDGAVYKDDDKLAKVIDELAAQGITEKDRRIRKSHTIVQRYFDNGGWLKEAEDTVFNMLPVVPFYGNFKIIDGKPVYRGAINKIMDQQRVHNMAFSREVEDVVLAPRPKYWGTPEQRKGHGASLSTLNTNSDSWQDYNHVDGMPPPYMQGGAQINPALSSLTMTSADSINMAAGVYSPQMGDNVNLQSGVALEKQINKGDIANRKFFTAFEVGLAQLGRVIVNAIPRAYDATRQQRILNEDGTGEIVYLNKPQFDTKTQSLITLNDLSIGEYDVTVSVGAKYSTKQEQMVEAFTRIAAIDPTIMELARDVWFRNIDQPGMDDVAERARAIGVGNGTIPETQFTDEEKAQAQQAAKAQSQQPDPMALAAQAEMVKGKADMLNAQVKQQEAQASQQVKMAQLQLESKKLELDTQKFLREKDDKYNVDAAKIQQGQQEIDLKAQQQQFQQMMDAQAAMLNEMKVQAETLKTMREAMGAGHEQAPERES